MSERVVGESIHLHIGVYILSYGTPKLSALCHDKSTLYHKLHLLYKCMQLIKSCGIIRHLWHSILSPCDVLPGERTLLLTFCNEAVQGRPFLFGIKIGQDLL